MRLDRYARAELKVPRWQGQKSRSPVPGGREFRRADQLSEVAGDVGCAHALGTDAQAGVGDRYPGG